MRISRVMTKAAGKDTDRNSALKKRMAADRAGAPRATIIVADRVADTNAGSVMNRR